MIDLIIGLIFLYGFIIFCFYILVFLFEIYEMTLGKLFKKITKWEDEHIPGGLTPWLCVIAAIATIIFDILVLYYK